MGFEKLLSKKLTSVGIGSAAVYGIAVAGIAPMVALPAMLVIGLISLFQIHKQSKIDEKKDQ